MARLQSSEFAARDRHPANDETGPQKLARFCERKIAEIEQDISACTDLTRSSELRKQRSEVESLLEFAKTRKGYLRVHSAR